MAENPASFEVATAGLTRSALAIKPTAAVAAAVFAGFAASAGRLMTLSAGEFGRVLRADHRHGGS
jgi:hypothetical protein